MKVPIEPRVDSNWFYSAEELKEILNGRIKVETLKAHGLVGLASGYWGENVIFAINQYWRTLVLERARGASGKEAQREIFENQGPELLDRREAKRLYSNGSEAHAERRTRVQASGSDSRSLESQSDLFERRTKEKAVQSGRA